MLQMDSQRFMPFFFLFLFSFLLLIWLGGKESELQRFSLPNISHC